MLNCYNQNWLFFKQNLKSIQRQLVFNQVLALMQFLSLNCQICSLLPQVIVHSTALSRVILHQIYAFGIAVVERFTAISIIFAVPITEFFLFSLCGRQLSCVPFAPFRSTILEPDLRREKWSKLIISIRRAFSVSKSQNKSLNRAFIWNGLFSIFHWYLTWCWDRREMSRRERRV